MIGLLALRLVQENQFLPREREIAGAFSGTFSVMGKETGWMEIDLQLFPSFDRGKTYAMAEGSEFLRLARFDRPICLQEVRNEPTRTTQAAARTITINRCWT